MRRFILLLSIVSLLLVSLSLTELAAAPHPAADLEGIRQHESALPSDAMTIMDVLQGRVFDAQAGTQSSLGDTAAPKHDASASALGTETFTSVADAGIVQGYPDLQFGGFDDMLVGVDESFDPPAKQPGVVRSLVRFDLSRLGGQTAVDQATLRIYLFNSWDIPGTDMTVTAHRVPQSWSEQQIMWSNAPAPAEAYGSVDVTHSEWGWYEIDVTALVQAWVNGTYTNHGFILVGDEEGLGRRGFSTREWNYPPELVVETSTVPPSPTATRTPFGIRTPTRTPSPTATRPGAKFNLYLPIILRAHRSGPPPEPTPTQTRPPSPSPTEPAAGEVVFRGTTSQDEEIELTVKEDQSAVMKVKLTYSFYCGGITTSGTATVSRTSGWPISGRSFEVEASCTFEVTGEFDPSFTTASGTWRGIACDPVRPWIEVCRGPIGTWNATRQ